MHLGTKMNIPYEAFLIPPDYQVWINYKELYWEGNSIIMAIINLIIARAQHPTKYIRLDCR